MTTLTKISAAVLLATSLQAMANEPLTLKVYHAGDTSFGVNSTLIYGEKEAAVIDAGFTRADGLRIAANVLDSGKELTTIFISQADPDYYFGAETLKKIFPDAKVVATPAVRSVIEQKMATKIAVWSPQMGVNAPTFPILPDAFQDTSFRVDGYKVEIKGDEGILAYRPYLWIPSLKAIVGNVSVSADVPIWMADTKSNDLMDAWVEQLHGMEKLNPEIVVPGHMTDNSDFDPSHINYTATYIEKFKAAKLSSENSQMLIDKMMQSYPADQVPGSLVLGAKVHMGEMEW